MPKRVEKWSKRAPNGSKRGPKSHFSSLAPPNGIRGGYSGKSGPETRNLVRNGPKSGRKVVPKVVSKGSRDHVSISERVGGLQEFDEPKRVPKVVEKWSQKCPRRVPDQDRVQIGPDLVRSGPIWSRSGSDLGPERVRSPTGTRGGQKVVEKWSQSGLKK